MNRFARTEMLLGKDALARLQNAGVLVAGLGAVGSYAVEGLARAGVGRLRLVDFDSIKTSNINRQIYALESTLGMPKAAAARDRVRDINPSCEVEARELFIDAETVSSVLAPPVDVVIDAIDSLGPKVTLLVAAVNAGLFTVSSMGAATRLDPSAIKVADISETSGCPLAAVLRKRLRKQGVERGIRCVFSTEPARPSSAASPPDAEDETFPRGRPRRTLGSISCITGIFGLTAAVEAILHIAGTRQDTSQDNRLHLRP